MLRAMKAGPDDEAKSPSAQQGARDASSGGLNDATREAWRGNPFALRHFLREIAPLVRSVSRGVMGREHPDLEDTIQDCLVDVVRALPRFRFEADVTHYVTRITMRRAIAARQRARARSQQYSAVDPSTVAVTTFDEGVEARAHLVRNLLDEISEAQSTVLRLRLMLGHSIGEIARITGVSVNTVKTRLRLGKNRLRRSLQRSGEGPRAH
jgi:RNA polymerase sigma factor (sigma-70 family)